MRELGLTLSMTDENSALSLGENEAMIGETAALMGINVQIELTDSGTFVTFYS
ncbi:hypothetical protein Z945_437 [Sulfitobacter noctilucae]|nr:hypothetical protein Z945_437 [Sulfitobacter noctilucae]